jgi:hypothetical protein
VHKEGSSDQQTIEEGNDIHAPPKKAGPISERLEHSKAAATYVYIFLSKLLIQALRKRAQCEFRRRKCGRSHVPAQTGRCTGKEQRAAFAVLVERLALERGDRLARERKCSFDVRFQDTVNFVFLNLQEWLPDSEACIEERGADVGMRPAFTHSAESALDFLIVVVGYWERRRLHIRTG